MLKEKEAEEEEDEEDDDDDDNDYDIYYNNLQVSLMAFGELSSSILVFKLFCYPGS
jgi:hypothetical protein